jgi:hypothetical protein
MNEAYTRENDHERQRLMRLTTKLTEADLIRPMANGWTVATKLAHLAFWDLYWLALIDEWEKTDFDYSRSKFDAINHGVLVLSRLIPPTAVVGLVRDAADAIDRKLETVSPQLVAAIETAGCVHILLRAQHRREHLDQIETTLGL